MAVIVTDTSAKCNTVVKDNICGTKCDTIVVTVLLLWCYLGNGSKCDTMAGNGSLLWPSFRECHMCFQGVYLSIPTVSTLYLKDLDRE